MALKKKAFPGGSAGKESSCNVGNQGLIPGLGRSPGEGKGYSLQDSGLENSMDCIAQGVAKSQTRLAFTTFTISLCLLLACQFLWGHSYHSYGAGGRQK